MVSGFRGFCPKRVINRKFSASRNRTPNRIMKLNSSRPPEGIGRRREDGLLIDFFLEICVFRKFIRSFRPNAPERRA